MENFKSIADLRREYKEAVVRTKKEAARLIKEGTKRDKGYTATELSCMCGGLLSPAAVGVNIAYGNLDSCNLRGHTETVSRTYVELREDGSIDSNSRIHRVSTRTIYSKMK